jgi:hypothetical protein
MNHLPLPSVRPLRANSRQFGFLISLAVLSIIVLPGAKLLFNLRPAVAAQDPPSCCGSDDTKPHVLVASYYSVKGRLSSKLLLNNKGPRPLEVRPTSLA